MKREGRQKAKSKTEAELNELAAKVEKRSKQLDEQEDKKHKEEEAAKLEKELLAAYGEEAEDDEKCSNKSKEEIVENLNELAELE